MRPPLRKVFFYARPLLAVMIVSLSFPSRAQRYDSMSATEVQRRLERDTDALIDELRSRRNTPLSSSNFNVDGSTWVQQLRAREAEKRAAREAWLEKQRSDAQWARDHPGESREQYYARISQERAAREGERQQRLAERAAAQRAEFIARQEALLENVRWDDFRRAAGGFATRERPPVFGSGQQAADWLIAHNRERPNQWAAVQAALLLMDGVNGTSRDPASAVRLVDPHTTSSRPDDDPVRPESRALHAFLRAAYPELSSAGDSPGAVADARRELEAIAETSDLAKWLLARLLADSQDPADHARALVLIAPGYTWALSDYAPFFGDGTPLRRGTLQYLDQLLVHLLDRYRLHLVAAQRDWSDRDFQRFARALGASASASTELLAIYTDVIAERAIPASPEKPFDDYHFGDVIAAAGRAGSATAHALATLDRLSLLHTGRPPGTYKRPYDTLADMDLAIPTLVAWARRDDSVGVRARLALAELADPAARAAGFVLPDSPEGRAWAEARTRAFVAESDDYQAWLKDKTFVRPSDTTQAAQARASAAETAAFAAFAKRERSAPPVSALPRLLANIEAAAAWEADVAAIRPFLSGATPPSFPIDDPSFDLAKAAALLDAAFAPGIPAGAARNRYLYTAAHLGDAYAPYALAIQASFPGEAPVRSALKEISAQRRARDEAAGRPRALLAKAIDALLRHEDATASLAAAAQAGSLLAKALQLDQRIGSEMAREVDRPPSWDLPPSQVATLDDVLTALHAQPDAFADWSLVHALASPSEVQHAAQRWFGYLATWDLDHKERIADDAVAKAIQPQVDAVLAALADWPGIHPNDPVRAAWEDASERDLAQAEETIQKGDGLAALRLFLAAAGRGERSALVLLSRHLRDGDGGLPRSASLADQIQAAALQMLIADAEVGDAFAAKTVGESYLAGRNGVEADPVKAGEWLRYAASIGSSAAARSLATAGEAGLAMSAADVFHWEVVQEALENGEHFLQQPRRRSGPRIDTASVRTRLEAAAAKFASHRGAPPVELSDAAAEKQGERLDAAQRALETDPLKGLVLLAEVAAEDHRYAAQDLARILATGDYGISPAQDLARRFHATVLGDLERKAEYGDEDCAHRIACRALTGIDGVRDIETGLRWLTYAAERGNYMSALLLGRIYTEGVVPGLSPNPAEATRWNTLADNIVNETFKPRPPLKR